MKVSTRAPALSGDAEDGPLGVLAEVCGEAAGDPDALAALAGPALAGLAATLKTHLGAGEAPDLSDPDRLRSLLADAARLARDRLLAS